jgi:hypothetical protein
MPRRSAASMHFPTITRMERLAPPPELNPDERTVFLNVVATNPADHFRPSDAVLLCVHVRAVLAEREAAEQLVAQEPLGDATTAAPLPGVVDGSGYVGPDPPTAPLVEQAGKATWRGRSTSDRHRHWRHQGNIRR